jgi:hypothetical protein
MWCWRHSGYKLRLKDSTVNEAIWNTLKPYLDGDTSNPILYAGP